MRDVIVLVVSVLLFVCVLAGGYWVAKNVSYAVFYEDMVIETIRQTVKPEYLKELVK